jgi:PilZ domain-containing protein
MNPVKTANRIPRRRNPEEQRCCPRFPFSPAVEATDIQANTRVLGRLSDIARHGCYMDTISPFAVKATVSLVITRDNQSFKTQANVVYSQVGMGMGLLFTAAEPDQLRQLEMWLGELSRGEMPDPSAETLKTTSDSGDIVDLKLRNILGELIILLGHKNVLNPAESQLLSRKLQKLR